MFDEVKINPALEEEYFKKKDYFSLIKIFKNKKIE